MLGMMKLPSTEPPACTERQKQRNKNRRHFRRLIGQAEMQFDCPSWPFFFIALVLIARENGQRYHRPQSDVYRHHVSLLCVFARLLLYRGKKKATPKRDNFYYNMALLSIRPICAHFVIYFALCHFYLPSRLYRGPFGSSSLLLFFAVFPSLIELHHNIYLSSFIS